MATGGECFQTIDLDSDGVNNLTCSPCRNDDKNTEGEFFCIECGEYFCNECIKYHNKFAMLKGHEVLDKAGMATLGPQHYGPVLTTERCVIHRGNTIDTYCPVHDEVGCGTCIALNHGSCQGISYIPKTAIGIKGSEAYRNIQSSIEKIHQQLSDMKETTKKDMGALDKEKDTAFKEIKSYRKKLNQELERMERNAIEELLAKHKDLENNIKANTKCLDDMLEKLETSLIKLERVKQDNESELFIHVKQGEKNQATGSEILQIMSTIEARGTLKFKRNEALEMQMTDSNLGSLFEETTTEKKKTEATKSKCLYGEFNIKSKNDKHQCNIIGSCLLEDGILMIIDRENKMLKRLDDSYKVTGSCELPGEPIGVSATGPREVTVALFKERKIHMVSVESTLKLTEIVPVEGFCSGIDYVNNCLIVSKLGDDSIEMTDEDGKTLKTVRHYLGLSFIGFYVAINTNLNKFYITSEEKEVTILDTERHHVARFSDTALRGASGICVLDNDDILVCGKYSDTIVQFDKDGRDVGVRLRKADGIIKPQSLCWDSVNSRLIVTMFQADTIKVYSLTNGEVTN